MSKGTPLEISGLLLRAQLQIHLAYAGILKMTGSAAKNYASIRGPLVEVGSLLKQVWDLILDLGPDEDHLVCSHSDGALHFPFEDRQEKLQVAQFKTNDLVKITGGLDGHRSLQISGLQPIELGKREFIVVKTLARFSRLRPGTYMTMPEILDAVSTEAASQPHPSGLVFWPYPMAEDIYRIANTLRGEIAAVGGNKNLIESSPTRGGGYRLSTPKGNIVVEGLNDDW